MTRRATIRTTHDEPTVLARAIEPDNTDEMRTTVSGDAVVTRIERGSTGGLHATVDDYVVNLDVAERIARLGGATRQSGAQHATEANQRTTSTDGSPSDTDTNTNE